MKIWNRQCTKCLLHKTAQTVGMDGPLQSSSVKLLIYVDCPTEEEDKKHKAGSSENIKMIRWLLERMSVQPEDVSIQFTLKCFKPKNALTKKEERLSAIQACSIHRMEDIKRQSPIAIVSMGSIGCEAFFGGAQLKTKEGTKSNPHDKEIKTIVNQVWQAYSPAYATQSPAESLRLYRVLFRAAEDAGLKPVHNPNVKPYEFNI